MLHVVLNGKPRTAMTGWKSRFSQLQAEALVDFIRRNFMQITEEELHPGAGLYAENCSVCHGDEGQGAVWGAASMQTPPRNFSIERLKRDRMIKSVAYGKPGTPMPGFSGQLDSLQVKQVVDYVQTRFMPAVRSGQSDPVDELHWPGNAQRGQAYYLANCVACHGIEGDGQGPRAYFIYPRPRNFIGIASQRFDREALFVGIRDGVKGREMPAWGKVLTDDQIVDIAEYVYRQFVENNGDVLEED